ncbi:MAG: pectate lyase, partial [Sphingobacteriales bacterium]
MLKYSFSGAIDSWASGVLFDVVNVDGNALLFGNRGQDGNGAGWTAANSVFWNCTAARIDCYKPPTAQNYSFGSWAQFSGDGYWGESNNTITPRSLFYQQLKERLNKDVDAQAQLLYVLTEASSSPSVEAAQQLTKEAAKPRMQLKEWIEAAAKRNAINTTSNAAVTIDVIGIKKATIPVAAPALQIKNGWLVRGDEIQTGKRTNVQWWSGGLQPKDI